MTQIVATIDGIHGDIKIVVYDGEEKQTMEFKWCVFDEDGSTGFMTSFAQSPIIVTEVAAEQLVRIVLHGLIRTFELSKEDVKIINHIGELIPDVQFLPPTFQGNEADIMILVAQQDSLSKLYAMYEEISVLNEDLMDLAREEGVLDDFLSLIQVRASGVFLAVKKPSQ